MRIRLRVAIAALGLAAGHVIVTRKLTDEQKDWILSGRAELLREDASETAVLPPAHETTAAPAGPMHRGEPSLECDLPIIQLRA